jgi:hypothetical protein
VKGRPCQWPCARLLTEPLENALSFSPPETKAAVRGQALPAGYLLEIEDQGIGMSEEQLAEANRRLSEPPPMDLAGTNRGSHPAPRPVQATRTGR